MRNSEDKKEMIITVGHSVHMLILLFPIISKKKWTYTQKQTTVKDDEIVRLINIQSYKKKKKKEETDALK